VAARAAIVAGDLSKVGAVLRKSGYHRWMTRIVDPGSLGKLADADNEDGRFPFCTDPTPLMAAFSHQPLPRSRHQWTTMAGLRKCKGQERAYGRTREQRVAFRQTRRSNTPRSQRPGLVCHWQTPPVSQVGDGPGKNHLWPGALPRGKVSKARVGCYPMSMVDAWISSRLAHAEQPPRQRRKNRLLRPGDHARYCVNPMLPTNRTPINTAMTAASAGRSWIRAAERPARRC